MAGLKSLPTIQLIPCFVLLFGIVSCANYTLMVPSTVNAGSTLDCLLTVLYDSPSDVTTTVSSSSTGETISSVQSPNGNGAVTPINIQIPDGYSGQYDLEISNDVFTAEVEFKVVSVPYAILIQTDKPIYKPSQTVNIRVAVIDHNLLPRNETIDVIIEDAEGNKIRQWRTEKLEMGLAQFSLPLSDRPPLGEWTITVSTDTAQQEKTIKIDEYVLPRFEVTVNLPSYILKSYQEVDLEVSAQYTYGEDVIGDLSLVITTTTGTITKDGYQISGTKSLTLALSDLQELGLTDGTSMTVQASVYEPLSGKTLSGSSQTPIESSHYQISFMEINSKSYRAGQTYTCYYEIAKPDGSRVDDQGMILTATLKGESYSGGSTTLETVDVPVPTDGTVSVSVQVPAEIADYYMLSLDSMLTLSDQTTRKGTTEDLSKFDSVNDDVSLQISSDVTGVPNVGDSVAVTVSSSSRTGTFVYLASSRARIIAYGSGTLDSPTFNLPITQEFTPQATLLVYAVVGGELLADSIQFNVEGTFLNEVSLEFRSSADSVITEAKPGDDVKVRVETEAGSTVGLLSVDKSVLLLGSGNDITQSQILTELMALVQTESECGDNDDSEPFRFFWFPRFGGSSSEDVVSGAGLKVVTDADLKECRPDYGYNIYYDGFMPEMYYEMEYAMAGAAPEDDEDMKATEKDNSGSVKKRQLFPETWLWDISASLLS